MRIQVLYENTFNLRAVSRVWVDNCHTGVFWRAGRNLTKADGRQSNQNQANQDIFHFDRPIKLCKNRNKEIQGLLIDIDFWLDGMSLC